jgi:hypothetical protein
MKIYGNLQIPHIFFAICIEKRLIFHLGGVLVVAETESLAAIPCFRLYDPNLAILILSAL